MSTLSGNATKGEKGKKFQQLKINLCSANKTTEPEQQQHKSNIQRKQHGMTSLGKVPTARRPTNLPSEKSEHSGNDPSVNLVPSGGAGWGNKTNETGSTTTTTPPVVQNANPTANVPVNSTPMPGTSQPVPHAQPYPPTSRMPPMAPQIPHVPVHHGHTDGKTWAMMTHGETPAPNFLAPQSPLFQHEFPSLSSNSETSSSSTPVTATSTQKPPSTVADTQYGPGPSLRPQTEGSWMQGGNRSQGSAAPAAGNPPATAPAPVRPIQPYPQHIGPDGARNNLAPSGVGVVPGGPGGPYPPPGMPQQHMMPPQYGGLLPNFMLRNPGYPGGFLPNFQGSMKGVTPRPPFVPYNMSGPHGPTERFMQPSASTSNSSKRPYDDEDVKIRSIIKEEDLNQMANIGNDIGWAGQEDIDYNQKLKFSDDEDEDKNKENRTRMRSKMQPPKSDEKVAEKKTNEKENDVRSSKESLKDKAFPTENRGQEIRNAWQRPTVMPASSGVRYQLPGPNRFDDDEENWQEKRRQKDEELQSSIERAKLRREEEEKRFIESQHNAALKLKQLEKKMFGSQRTNEENKEPTYGTETDIDMLPDWEKEKFRAQNKSNENQNADESKKAQNSVPVPVVKDASEFRELTQLVDSSTFAKKDKERESSSGGFSRPFANNIPPRFQNVNRQNSGGFSNSSTSSQNLDSRRSNVSQMSQFSNKSNSPSFGGNRHRLEPDSSDKGKDWSQEEVRKERYISEERESESRFQRENVRDRAYGFDKEDDRKYESKYPKENELKRKYYGDKGDYVADSYNREFDRENYNTKFNERRSSESERSDKGKDYESHRFSESENQEKEMKWRSHIDSAEKPKHFGGSTRPTRLISEGDSHENEKKNYGSDKEREYYRKGEGLGREKSEFEKGKDQERGQFGAYKNAEVDHARDREHDKKEKDFRKDQERKSPSPYEDRLPRNDGRENRFQRGSRETLREETYIIQEERTYPWTDDVDIEEKHFSRRDHVKEDRGDRYSHAHRHIPGPITREKLEAKELESEKRNLTTLVRSDKKTEPKKTEGDDKKEKKEKSDSNTSEAGILSLRQKADEPIKSAWNKDDKKDKSKGLQGENENHASEKHDGEKEDTKEGSKSMSKSDELASKSSDDKRSDRKKSERGSKRDTRSSSNSSNNNWQRHVVYRGNTYAPGGRSDPKLRRFSRGPSTKGSVRQDSKYSESDYSDEVSGSGREDKNSRGEREVSRSTKTSSKRYERDDRNRDYRIDNRDSRNYMGNSRGREHEYYYGPKPPQRGRGGFRTAITGGKRMENYGPPPSKSPFSSSSSYLEEKKQKPISKDSSSGSVNEQSTSDKKADSHVAGSKPSFDGKMASSRHSAESDRGWKKIDNTQENKSAISSSTSTQTAEPNEENFATASEGTDSDDNTGLQRSRQNSRSGSKRQTVVVAKPGRRNYNRSTSGKRYDSRRTAGLYPRKDSGSYAVPKKPTLTTGSKPSAGNKENEKLINEHSTESNFNKDLDEKFGDKSRGRDFGSSQAKKSKPRNHSNSRNKSSRTSAVSSGRGKSGLDLPPHSQMKPKKNSFDAKLDIKDDYGPPIPAPPPTVNAWDKPITGVLRTGSPSVSASSNMANSSVASTAVSASNIMHEKNVTQMNEHHAESFGHPSDISNVSAEKSKVLENLDGATAPVKTIIFENTNYKSGPNDIASKSKYSSQLKSHRYDKDMKLDSLDSSDINSFTDSNSELQNKHDALQMALAFNKNEDASDMKLDFTFDSEFSKLTDDKNAKAMELTHAMHMVQSSTDADLNFKIASVKKVWDGSLVEHFDDKYDSGMVNAATSFSPAFTGHGTDPNNGTCYVSSHMEATHVQVDEVGSLGHNEIVYNAVSQMQGVNANYGASANCQSVMMKNDATSSNVCKVKPQPQGCSTNMGNVQSAIMSGTLVSQPPPMSSPSYSFSCSTPQPNLSNNVVPTAPLPQMNFQGPYNSMPPIPSPPVLYNSSQAPSQATAGLYQAFQIDNAQVPAGSQYNRYQTSYGLSNAIGQASTFSQQSFVVQTPPNGPPPEMYSSGMNPYRIPAQPFPNSQQITSPNTVLISSTSNTLMSTTIKPSNQQIGAIGTKTGYAGAQNSPQIIMAIDPSNALLNHQSFLPPSQLIQRPTASLQSSTSYYTAGSSAGQASFFQPGSNTAVQPPSGSAIGLAAFNAQPGTPSYGPTVQNFNSQQFRTAPGPYLKSAGNACNMPSDYGSAKGLTLSGQHDALNSAFPAGSQMNSAKQRLQPGGKTVQSVQHSMAQHSMSQNPYGYQATNQMRNNGGANKGSQFPHPIQRPVSHGNNSNRSGNNTNISSASHRMAVRNNTHQLVNNIQQPPSSVYYTASSGYTGSAKLEVSSLDAKTESTSDSKLADSIKTINSKPMTGTSAEKNSTANE